YFIVLLLQSFSVYSNAHHQDIHSFPTRRSSDLSKIRLNDTYAQAVVQSKDKETMQLWKGRLTEARELLHSIEQREKTLLKVARRSEEHTSELQSRFDLVCRLLLEKKKLTNTINT